MPAPPPSADSARTRDAAATDPTGDGTGQSPAQTTGRAAARRLRWSYRLSLLAVALLTVAAQVVIHWNLNRAERDAKVINVAGRQRMLSQRTTSQALQLTQTLRHEPDNHTLHSDLQGELAETFRLLATSHKALRAGPAETELGAPVSPRVTAHFEAMRPHYDQMGQGVTALLAAARQEDADRYRAAMARILEAQGPFLREMNALVGTYESIARDRIADFGRLELVLAAATLLLLILAGRLVFEPAVRRVDAQIRANAIVHEAQLRAQLAREQTTKVVTAGFGPPLETIRSHAHRIANTAHGEPETLGIEIERSAGQLLRQVADLLLVESHGPQEVTPMLLDAAHLVTACLAGMQEPAQQAGVDLCALTPRDEVLVHSDRRLLQKILRALVDNGIRFNPGGTVQVLLQEPDGSGWFEVQVADDGPGIPADQQERVFDRYVQLPGPDGGTAAGAGLGLTLAREAARSLGGEITIASESGSGTSVRVRLPAMAKVAGLRTAGPTQPPVPTAERPAAPL